MVNELNTKLINAGLKCAVSRVSSPTYKQFLHLTLIKSIARNVSPCSPQSAFTNETDNDETVLTYFNQSE